MQMVSKGDTVPDLAVAELMKAVVILLANYQFAM